MNVSNRLFVSGKATICNRNEGTVSRFISSTVQNFENQCHRVSLKQTEKKTLLIDTALISVHTAGKRVYSMSHDICNRFDTTYRIDENVLFIIDPNIEIFILIAFCFVIEVNVYPKTIMLPKIS